MRDYAMVQDSWMFGGMKRWQVTFEGMFLSICMEVKVDLEWYDLFKMLTSN